MIAVVDYGIGNLRSAEKALQHVGAPAQLSDDPETVAAADGVVLPGVGEFGACAAALATTGLRSAVEEALRRAVPFLGLCVGYQLLHEGSDESPGAEGLGAFGGVVRALPDGVKRPQMQWNRLRREGPPSGLLEGLEEEPFVYFVHSFAPERGEDTVASCDYGAWLAAASERGPVWGTQFHPEKSGREGLAVLANFAGRCAA